MPRLGGGAAILVRCSTSNTTTLTSDHHALHGAADARALAAADRGDDVEPGAGGELGVEPAALPVDVDVDVGP